MISIKKDGFYSDYYDKTSKVWLEVKIDKPTMNELHSTECKIEDGVILRDILNTMNLELDFWNEHIGNYCKEFIKEGLEDFHGDQTLDKLELYWHSETFEGDFQLSNHMQLHGLEDLESVSISLSPINSISHLSVVVNENFSIWEDMKTEKKIGRLRPTLFEILYGMFWEFSFYGIPEKRMEVVKELQKLKERIDNGEEMLYSWDELKGG